MMRSGLPHALLFALLCVFAANAPRLLAGDYVHLPSGRVAFDRVDRKYQSAEAVRAGWRPVERSAMPPEALAMSRRTGKLDPATWLLKEDGSIEAHDPGAVAAGIEEEARAATAQALADRALLIAQLRSALALVDEIGSGVEAGTVQAARSILLSKIGEAEGKSR